MYNIPLKLSNNFINKRFEMSTFVEIYKFDLYKKNDHSINKFNYIFFENL